MPQFIDLQKKLIYFLVIVSHDEYNCKLGHLVSLVNEDLYAFIYIGGAKPEIGAGKTVRAPCYYLRSTWNTVS